ncbi:MAG: hypothetical protein CMD99_00830 [Gammaproteobacteria bacterium]|nr:hypothetical protein [Gammaproteobacteria bacterium]|tara:strand:- start:765 stop:1247 length:483 start_codon:yes stop_codon:yes gene_type:complete
MRPIRTRRRVLESLAKAKSLVAVRAENRLQHHALGEAVLHQIDATLLALVRQVGDAHGVKPENIGSLNDLTAQLTQRNLVSLEAQRMQILAKDSESWWNAFQMHYATIICPDEVSRSFDIDRIPLADPTGLDRLKSERYSGWIEELSGLVEDFQVRFDES